ncbi:hypothetical protein ACO1PF_10945 [Alkalibacterium sp. f15]
MYQYALDITAGPDGKCHLYYVLDKVSIVSVTIIDTPAGKFKLYGYMRDK